MTRIPYTDVKIPYTDKSVDPEIGIVLGVGKEYGIDEAMLIYTSKIEVKNWVLLKCKYGCEKYGESFCCPPNSIPPDETRKILREYKRAIFIAAKIKTIEEQAKLREAMIEMEKALFLKNFYKAFALVPGCCDKCDKCSAGNSKGCKNPQHKRPCIEGTGIDVFALVRKHKKNIQTLEDKNKSFESYGLILLD